MSTKRVGGNICASELDALRVLNIRMDYRDASLGDTSAWLDLGAAQYQDEAMGVGGEDVWAISS